MIRSTTLTKRSWKKNTIQYSICKINSPFLVFIKGPAWEQEEEKISFWISDNFCNTPERKSVNPLRNASHNTSVSNDFSFFCFPVSFLSRSQHEWRLIFSASWHLIWSSRSTQTYNSQFFQCNLVARRGSCFIINFSTLKCHCWHSRISFFLLPF